MAEAVFTVGLIGSTISHSLSPAMHNAAFTYHRLQERYALWPVSEAELPDRIAALRTRGIRGANVTIPYKSLALPLVDELGLDPDVALLGALNTIVHRAEETLLGLNTDVEGFLHALRGAGYEPHGGHAVLLGAGGAARAVAWGLLRSGIASLAVVNRSVERAAKLLEEVAAAHPPGPALCALHPDDPALRERVECATLLVNATPVGVDGEAMPLAATLLHGGLFVSDLIYRPTPLLHAAAAQGAATQDGLEMLVQQGALAFEAWTSLPAPVDVMRQAATEARAAVS